ncbi:MAG: hypothetical protein ACXQT3_02920 [Methermicoccaceae archaeon]
MNEQIERIPQELLPHHAPRPRYVMEVEVHWVEVVREGDYETYYVHINEHLTQSRATLVFRSYDELPDGVKRWLKEHKEVIE